MSFPSEDVVLGKFVVCRIIIHFIAKRQFRGIGTGLWRGVRVISSQLKLWTSLIIMSEASLLSRRKTMLKFDLDLILVYIVRKGHSL